ncbi:MAG: insulinase family protein [Bacteroidales bacterium]|nr:insulinase family protein [Bacteroidales bacterium]
MYQITTLSNGIRIVHKEIDSEVSYCGMIINTGTRDESENQHGIAHFTEHLLFKGTRKRKTFQILNRMENVGAEIDAYTSKEETCVTVAFLNEYYERTIDYINDIIFNSQFPEKEIIKEQDIIIDEINSYKDNPAEIIFDDFENFLYPNHSLGYNILGTKIQLKKYKINDFKKYTSEKYNTDQMVLCSIGNIKFDKLVKICKKYFEKNPGNYRTFIRESFSKKIIFNKIIKKNTYQTHCILGTYAYSVKEDKRLPLMLLTNYLGGSGMNSKLLTALREKKGLCYNIEANFNPYEDIGNFNIYFGVDKENTEKVIQLIYKELETLKIKGINDIQLSKIKKQFIGQMILTNSIHSNILISLGKSLLVYNQIETLQESVKEIETISSKEILEVANEILDIHNFSTLIYN